MDKKMCRTCGMMKPSTREYFGSTPSGGLRHKCRVCMNAYSREYGQDNRDKRSVRNTKRSVLGGHARLDREGQLKLLKRQKYICPLCRARIVAEDVTQIDHLTPVIQGGTHSISNLAIVHKQCNAEKHGKTLEEHWEWREKVGLDIPKKTSMKRAR